MKCPNCQFDNPSEARFCQNCGHSLTRSCPNCGTVNSLAAKYCMECGTRLEAATQVPQQPARFGDRLVSERRVVTILFCDVQGSTTLAEQVDPEVWAEVMDGAFDFLVAAVVRYDGTVARLMGDAVLAIFGAPQAHEDDPSRAIRAGLDLLSDLRPYQDEVRRRLLADGAEIGPSDFEVRVGINTGLVVVGEVGSEGGHEYTAMGDAVNIAARLQQTAKPGTIQITQDTYKLVAPLIEVEALGAVAVKGKREPVNTYRVLNFKTQPGPLRGLRGLTGMEAPLVGRERELTQLEWFLADLKDGKGRIVCLMGEAGLGKSRLVAESRRLELSRGSRWLEAASLSFEQDQPYGLIRRLIRSQVGAAEGDVYQAMIDKLDLLLTNLEEDQRAEFQKAVKALFGIATREDQPSLEGEGLGDALSTGMAALWRASAADQPLVLVFEDLHWTDRASVELIGRLLPLATEAPILFLCVFRPDHDRPSWQLKERAESELPHHFSAIMLHPLNDQESSALASSLMTVADLPQSLRDLIWQKAAGIPFFVEEIVRELVDSGLVVPSQDDDWMLAGDVAEIPVPENLESLLVARMDRLEEPVRRTLQLAAVIGRTFYYRVLAQVSGDGQALENQLKTLQDADLIREAARTPEPEYMFRHVLTQEAAYDTILLKDRRRYHHRTGEVMVQIFAGELQEHAPLLAYHFTRAGDQAQALTYYAMAAEHASRLYANSEALRHYGHALEAADLAAVDDETVVDLLIGRGAIHERQGDFNQARADFDAALKLAQEAGERRAEWQALLNLGKLWASRDYDRTGDYFRQALEIARQLDDPVSLAKSLNRMGNWYVNAAKPAEGLAYHHEALALFEELDDRSDLADTQDLLGMANLIAGDMVASVNHYRQALELYEELGESQGKVSSQSIMFQAPGSYLLYTVVTVGDFEETEKMGDETLALARQIGWQPGEAFILEVLGSRYALRGEFGQALEPAREALKLATEIGHHQWMVGAHVSLGNVYQAMLALKDARNHMKQALALAQTIRSEFWRNIASGYLAEIYLEMGQPDLAQIGLDEVLSPEFVTDTLGQRLCWLARAEIALAQNEPGQALTIIDQLIDTSANMGPGVVISSLWLARGRALQAVGKLEEAESILREGLDHTATRGERSLCWRFQANLARLYREMDRPEQARREVSQGLALVEEMSGTISDVDMRNNFISQAKKHFAAD